MGPQGVTLTDMKEVVPLITANVLLNSIVVNDPAVQTMLRYRYHAAAYCWGGAADLETAADQKVPYFDVILASDVVYYPEGYEPLLATLCDLLCAQDCRAGATAGPVCILAHRHRHPEDSKFFNALFASPVLCARRLDFQAQQKQAAAGDGGDSNDTVQALKDVILFEITRR